VSHTIEYDDQFARRLAETQNFTLGYPRNFALAGDGKWALFLKSDGPTDSNLRLWRWNLETNATSVLLDARADEQTAQLNEVEKERRERLRERAGGITSFAIDAHGTCVVTSVGGELICADYTTGEVTRYDSPGYVIDPRIAHGRIAGVIDRALWLLGPNPRPLISPADEFTSFGLPDFLAAEEFSRHRGFWWSPRGNQLLVQEVDTSKVAKWWISDASSPEAEPRSVRYPAAGKQNPATKLWLVDLAGDTTQVDVLSEENCYLTRVEWNATRGLMVAVLNRAQDRMRVIAVETSDGSTKELMTLTDPHWVEVLGGLPTWAPKSTGANVLHVVDDLNANSRRLALDGQVFSDESILIDSVIGVNESGVIANGFSQPTTQKVFKIDWTGAAQALTDSSAWATAVSSQGGPADLGENVLLIQANPNNLEAKIWIHNGPRLSVQITSQALAAQNVEFVSGAPYPTVIVWPQGFLRDSEKLPIVLAPYGGPHGKRVINASPRTFASGQLLANQGFAVVVIDGPGTPALGPVVEKMVAGDLLNPAIKGQVTGLARVLALYPNSLDGSRVGIHGWSFGGYLAAGAVLSRPDVFHAAIAGAPVSDWQLYDTAYSERYLGQPHGETQANYQRSSLIPLAPQLARPLLLVHGVADDNVFFAHTLQLSGALTAAGKEHSVLPLSGATHMTSDVTLTERLEQLTIDFFTQHLKPGGTR